MIQLTEDISLISKVCNHPQVFDWISDDCSQKPYVPGLTGSIFLTDETNSAIISIEHWNGITCQVHMAAIPSMWGRGHEMVTEALRWGFKNTRYSKVLGIVPEYNGFVRKLLEDTGFSEEGTIKASWLKNFRKYDQIVYGISKYDFIRRK